MKTGHLSNHKRNGYACYFPTGKRDRRHMPAATVLVAPGAKALLDAALARPGATLAELEAATGFSRGTTRHHLERFQREGLLRTEMVAGRWQVFPTELGRERGGAAAGGGATDAPNLSVRDVGNRVGWVGWRTHLPFEEGLLPQPRPDALSFSAAPPGTGRVAAAL